MKGILNMKKKLLYVFLSVIILAVLALIVTLLVLGRPALGLDARYEDGKGKKISTSTDAAPEELERCYDYTEKYFSSAITDDDAELKKIISDIETVIEKDYYCSHFYGSEFAERLENDPSFLKNDGSDSRNFLIAEYYREIIIVELKALLMLGEYDEFKNVFIENYYLVSASFGADRDFAYIIKNDEGIVQNEERVFAIMDVYDSLIEYELSEEAEWYISLDACKMSTVGDFVEKRIEPFRSIVKALRPKAYYETVDMLENEELNPNKFRLKLGIVFVK